MDTNNYVYVRITRKQLEKLVDVLEGTQDEGPYNAGWASKELAELRNLFGVELEALKKA
jgi:hypothetical protein